ncbi:PaaI family thioesterase [Pseudomonas fontis]|uniref:Acyl-coenzyme A thioesterase THEM4 n=1 Tax=Pseudomonas fontis TaxID=2942633 RepID=A0ABT5NUC6_9PSED|nr:PaaI family thioesterase [Pseudomonas fontis]MDD0973938.1 PaaI family thioesterase [Pseudomonas fontis]MDD0991780.1 PaaI family thioesterase [Pseudomonas fontis]
MSCESLSLQDLAAPQGVCYGCGTAHPNGLHLKSHWDDDGIHVVCKHEPGGEFIGWPGLVYGGLLAMLVDCHSNWTAMAYHYRAEGREPGSLPRIDCVTGQLGLTYLKPTPMGVELVLKARVEGEVGRKSRVICEVWAGDVLTVTADSVFVRVDTERLKQQAHANA